MHPHKALVGLRGSATAASTNNSFDTLEGITKWLQKENQEVFSGFDAACPPGRWLIEFSLPDSWATYGWNLKKLKMVDSTGQDMAISVGPLDGWSPAPEGFGPDKALDGNYDTWYRHPSLQDGYDRMDKKFCWGGEIQTVSDWTLEDCMNWCNDHDDCDAFQYDRDAQHGPNREIMAEISFQMQCEWPQDDDDDFYTIFVKRHAYSGPQVVKFVAKEIWRNGSLDIPKYTWVGSYGEQPPDGPVLMQIRYLQRDGKTTAPTPLVAQAPLENVTLQLYTKCYGNGSSSWSEAFSQPLQSDSCESEQCFVRDYSALRKSIEGVDGIVGSARKCQTACQHYKGCVYWTWYGTAADETKNSCVLSTKASVAFKLKPGAVSGPRSCMNP
jgi:hypothetical protein